MCANFYKATCFVHALCTLPPIVRPTGNMSWMSHTPEEGLRSVASQQKKFTTLHHDNINSDASRRLAHALTSKCSAMADLMRCSLASCSASAALACTAPSWACSSTISLLASLSRACTSLGWLTLRNTRFLILQHRAAYLHLIHCSWDRCPLAASALDACRHKPAPEAPVHISPGICMSCGHE